ncbi:hypothetical protein SRABI83_03523 [Arthrobacter sp. Bi83]|nr:hypothetical protein SRABI83_03523 [Arthrobacter sp. Bi83]
MPTFGARAQATDATAIRIVPATRGMRRPRWSLKGPPTSWPSPIPAKNVVRVNCTADAVVPNSCDTRGNAGTYMSVASGATAVRKMTVATSAAGTAPDGRDRVVVDDVLMAAGVP